jgi:hypothetical protein
MRLLNKGDLMGRFDLIEVTSWAGLTIIEVTSLAGLTIMIIEVTSWTGLT